MIKYCILTSLFCKNQRSIKNRITESEDTLNRTELSITELNRTEQNRTELNRTEQNRPSVVEQFFS